jgi:hypothetical protein
MELESAGDRLEGFQANDGGVLFRPFPASMSLSSPVDVVVP